MRARLERGPNYVNFGSAPRVIRTPDLLIRSQTLYPTELWARDEERLVLAAVSLVNSHPPGGPARGSEFPALRPPMVARREYSCFTGRSFHEPSEARTGERPTERYCHCRFDIRVPPHAEPRRRLLH